MDRVVVQQMQYLVEEREEERVRESSYSCFPLPRQIPIRLSVKAVI